MNNKKQLTKPTIGEKILAYSILIHFPLALSLGCDDTTTGLMPADPNRPIAGSDIIGGEMMAGGQGLGGRMNGGSEAGIMQAGEASAGIEDLCDVTCDANTTCDPLNCLCPDGRSASFNGCLNGCCASASANRESACAELCSTLPEAECSPGESRCLEENAAAIQRCNAQGEWSLNSCGADESCALGECLPTNCLDGQTRCLTPSQVVICQGGAWTLGESCDGGACSGGICQSLACAQAAAERSYLGCEYLTLELPNAVRGAANVSSTAVVVTNPSIDENAFIQLFDPSGNPTSLLNEQLITVPNIPEVPPGLYSSQTIRSEVRDASGELVESGVVQANQLSVPPGGIATLLLPAAEWPSEGSMVRSVAHRLVSDLPIGAYQFNPYCCNFSFSNDASLLIPTSALGQDYLYLGAPTLHGLSIRGEYYHPATSVIVAHRDQTVVRLSVPPGQSIQVETEGRVVEERGAYVVTLNQQEAFLLRTSKNQVNFFEPELPQPDLSGAYIQSDQPVAVFSGHECMYYPSTSPACDHLEEQLFPIDTWGTEFLLVPPKERRPNAIFERVYWKIIGQNSDAQVTLSAPFSEIEAAGPGEIGVPDCGQLLEADGQTINLGPRGFCEFSTKRAVGLSANQGVMIMGILSGQASVDQGSTFGTHLGDPAIFLLPPARQARRDYAFLTPNTYFSDFATITFAEGAQISLDGQALDLSGALNIAGSTQKYVHVELSDGPHKIEGNSPFSLLVVAYDDFVSYAFTGGLNLSKR